MNNKRLFQFVLTLLIAIIVVWAFISIYQSRMKGVDLVLLNGKIITVDESKPEAQALAIDGDRIIAVGSDAEIRTYIGGNTEVIDLDGHLAIPGFIDSHMHFFSLGESLMELRLAGARNFDEIVAMVKEAVENSQPGEWILGNGWHQEKWDKTPSPNIDGLPYHQALSAVSPGNPVLLSHASGHSCIANARAMELAGITADTPDPEGGEIIRDSEGRPIGIFRENADKPLYDALEKSRANRAPEEVEAYRKKVVELAAAECLSKGVTTVHDAGASFERIDFYKETADTGEIGVRLWIMINENIDSLRARGTEYGFYRIGNNHLTVGGIKRLIDGALGSHGAWLFEPYDDLPTSVGLNTEPIEDMKETARLAMELGFQLCTHAIGDRGNRETLDIYEEAFKNNPDREDPRWRIEHAQHVHPDDIPRFGRMGVIASMQGVHATSDGPWAPKRLGEKRSGESAYAWRRLMDSGATIANGTDSPVEDIDPLACFHASVTRKLSDGSLFYPEQCMTREEALKSYTISGAYAAFEEDIKGSLAPGKLADITVLSRDIMTIPANDIPGAEVLYTIAGGKILFQR
ncbi:MAG: amidohydrolase [Candidatus Zixiibacteriota bacterium]|nr:MAG: amidohydrolase [candidate division Zixibacteria bacterium]